MSAVPIVLRCTLIAVLLAPVRAGAGPGDASHPNHHGEAGPTDPDREGQESEAAVRAAVLRTQRDIERDTQALNEVRARVAEARGPLAARLDALQKTVRERRAEVERVRRLRVHGEKEQADLLAEAAAIEDEGRFLLALFAEYARAMETRIGAAEASRLVPEWGPIRAALAERETLEGLADAIGRLLAASAETNAERLGGWRFDGVALDAAGIERPGRFAALGPVAYFAADGEGPAGMAVTQFGSTLPAVYDRLPEGAGPAIRDLVNGQPARIPVDVTGGDAIKVAEARPTVIEHLKQGGFVMIPLLGVAAVAALLAVWKTIELGGVRVESGPDIDAAIEAARRGDVEAARQAAARVKHPLRPLLEEAIQHRDSPRDHLEEIMHERVLASLPRLERNLGTLAVLGGIAPLLGLLGTVTGMIHTFQLVTVFGSGDAKLLSGGISEALVTTEFGLAIAIPVLLVHAVLARRARGIVGALERMAVAIVNDLKVRHGPP